MADRIQTQIDIAIKGSAEIVKTQKKLGQLAGEIKKINERSRGFVQSFAKINDQLRLSNILFNNAASGTTAYRKSIETLVKTESAYNAELNKRNLLLKGARSAQGMGLAVDPVLKSIERNRRKTRPTQSTGGGYIEFSQNADKILAQKILTQKQGEKELQQALLALEIKSAKTLNEKLQIQGELNRKTAEAVNNAKLRGQFSPLTSDIRGNIGDIKSRRESNILSSRRNQFGNVFTGRSGRDFGQIGGRIGPVEPVRSAGGFSAFSARADEIARLTTEEQNLNNIRVKASQELKVLTRRNDRLLRVQKGRSKQEKLRNAQSNALIGGAFPLLFGQGLGAAVGGAAGGFAGGKMGGQFGFALSLVGTNLGSLVDRLVSGASELGQALGPFSRNTESVVTSLGLQNSAQAEQIKFIQQTKGETAAFNAAMRLMANDIGQNGVSALQRFGESSKLLGGEFKLALTRLQSFTAEILNFILKISGAENALKKSSNNRLIEDAAQRGNTQALDIQRRQAAINAMPKKKLKGTSGSLVGDLEVMSDEAFKKQQSLDIDKEILATQERGRILAQSKSVQSENLIKTVQDELNLRNKVETLMKEGNSKTLSEKIAKTQFIFEKEKEMGLQEIEKNNKLIKDNNLIGKEKERLLNINIGINKFLEERIPIMDKLIKDQRNLNDETDRYKVTNEEIAKLLATETTNAVMGLIDGTRTLGESLASVAKSLARMFLNAGFGNMFNKIFKVTPGEQGLYNRAGSFKAFQYGGVVSSPTLGMIGEGGEPEYVIPSSKMSGAMARYSAGARGGAVIPGGSGASGTVAGSSGNTIVEYTGPVLNFNGDEYVPKSAVPEIINTAARQGGEAGKTKAISALRNSRSQRASLGL